MEKRYPRRTLNTASVHPLQIVQIQIVSPRIAPLMPPAAAHQSTRAAPYQPPKADSPLLVGPRAHPPTPCVRSSPADCARRVHSGSQSCPPASPTLPKANSVLSMPASAT